MDADTCFRFARDDLQRQLADALTSAGVDHRIATDGSIRTRACDEPAADDARCAVRSGVFDDWWTVSMCCREYRDRFRQYMVEHGISFIEERENDTTWFTLHTDDDPDEFDLGPCTAW